MPQSALILPLAALVIPPDRQRQDFDSESLYELAQSIKKNGLIHAPRVQADGRTLVVGERRVRAIKEHLVPFNIGVEYAGETLPVGCVPVYPVGERDSLGLEELEFEENERRKDLSWQERARALDRLHSFRVRQAEAEGRTHTIVDTTLEVDKKAAERVAGEGKSARDLGGARNAVREQLILAKHLDNPEVAKAKTAKDAFKILTRNEHTARIAALGIAVGKTFSKADHTLLKGNCLSHMKDLLIAGSRFDVICTDPPYGMGADLFGDGAGRLANAAHHYKDDYESWKALMQHWVPLSYQISKEQAHMYLFCDIDRFHELRALVAQAGWTVHRTPFTIYKTDSGRVPWPDSGPRRQSEWVLYAKKGDKLTNMIAGDVILSEADENLGFGAQKPIMVFQELLRRSVKPGDAVLDSFGGTGAIIPACHALRCKATVIEKEDYQFGLCSQRLEKLDG